MDNFIFHKELKDKLEFIIDKSDKLGGVLCFHGLPGCGKTTFSEYYAYKVAKEVSIFDANSHLFDKSSAADILNMIKETGRTNPLTALQDDVNFNQNGCWDRCFIIDEFHNLSEKRQDAYKVSLEKVSKELNALFILIVNTNKERPLNKTLTSAILSRCQAIDFDIKKQHFDEVTVLLRKRYPMLDENFIKRTLPDLRQIMKRVKLLS